LGIPGPHATFLKSTARSFNGENPGYFFEVKSLFDDFNHVLAKSMWGDWLPEFNVLL
jgi:hypothetical protein